MPVLIAIAGFLGAWLLVAGPVYQAAVELDAEQVDREAVAAADGSVAPQAAVSGWWWLLPPVALLRRRRATRQHREAVLRAMTTDQVGHLIGFGAKATGWLIVAVGAALIGVKETWELVELLDWQGWAFPVLLVAGLGCALLYGPLRLRRDHRMLRSRAASATGTAPASTGSVVAGAAPGQTVSETDSV